MDRRVGWALLPGLVGLLAALAWTSSRPSEDLAEAPPEPPPLAAPAAAPAAPSLLERLGQAVDASPAEPPFAVVVEPPPAGLAGPEPGQAGPLDGSNAALQRALAPRLGKLLRRRGERFGVVVEDVASGARLEHNPRHVFPAASVYKLPLAYEVLRRRDAGWLTLDERLTIQPDDALEPEPDGGPGPGEELSIRDALRAMLAVSSNSAGHALLRRLGRPEFNAAMTALGLRDTRVPLSSGDDEAAVTSAADMAQLLRRLVREELLTDDSRRELADLLALREPLDPLPDAVPDGTPVYSKVGTLEAASNVAGVIITPSGPLIVSIFDRNVDPGIARAITADLVEAVLEVYGEQ